MVPIFLRIRNIDSVYWTLAIEMTFYALMFLVYITGNLKRIDILAWLFLLGSVVFKLVHNHFEPIETIHHHIRLITHLPLFVAGIIFFQISSKGYTLNRVALIVVSFLAASFTFDLGMYNVGYYWHVAAVAVFYGIFFAIQHKKAGWLNFGPLLWLGRISYPLYLLHYNIGFLVIFHLGNLGLPLELGSIIALFVSVALAYLVNLLVERKVSGMLRDFLMAKIITTKTN